MHFCPLLLLIIVIQSQNVCLHVFLFPDWILVTSHTSY